MQCCEVEIMLVHIRIELATQLPDGCLDRHLLCEVLEALDVNSYKELRVMEGPQILACARRYPGLYASAA